MDRKLEGRFVKQDVAICNECGCGEIMEHYNGVSYCEECLLIEPDIKYIPYDEYYDQDN